MLHSVYFGYSLDGYALPAGTVLTYDRIISNVGGYYNPVTGAFLCPVNGIYMFSLTVTAGVGSGMYRAYAWIYKDDNTLSYVWALDKSGTQEYASGTTVVVTECAAGTRVWTAVAFDSVFSSFHHSNQFSGFLITSY